MEKKRIALLGGSFNPIHIGHELICHWALATHQADEVWLVPVFRHAFDKELIDYDLRLRMCERAASNFKEKKVLVSTVERDLGGKSLTYNTVNALKKMYPQMAFSLLIGADIVEEISTWHRAEELMNEVHLIEIGRPGYQSDHISFVDISSTVIRNRIAKGKDVRDFLSADVYQFIETHQLYRQGE